MRRGAGSVERAAAENGVARLLVASGAAVLLAAVVPLAWVPGADASFEGGEADLSVPVRWCGVAGAPSMETPGIVPNSWGGFEGTTDDVLWRRHERPSEFIYIPIAELTFRSGATGDIKNGPQSFPIIRDPSGTGGDINADTTEDGDALSVCRHAWLLGDAPYHDANSNGVVDAGVDTWLSSEAPAVGSIEVGHAGAGLIVCSAVACPDVAFVDADDSGGFNVGDRLYRDEDGDSVVSAGDTLLSVGPATGVVVGNVDAADLAASEPLAAVPAQVRFVDLIREPPSRFHIGYPSVVGMTAVSANDLFKPTLAFPIHGLSPYACSNAIVVDDALQYLPDYELFETQLVGHEFGHGLCLNHGDGDDDDDDGNLDDGDDPTAPVPGAGPGTLCDADNLMQYCWRDDGSPGNPTMVWIGVGAPGSGTLTAEQVTVVRGEALTIPDTMIDPVPLPLEAAREDYIGDVPAGALHVDITSVNVTVDVERRATAFGLLTRSAFPQAVDAQFAFAVDADHDARTGGRPTDLGVRSTLAGAELVGIVKVSRPAAVTAVLPGVATTTLHRYNANAKAFEPVFDPSVVGTWRTLETEVDFAGAPRRPFAEAIQLSMSNATRGPLAAQFRVEFVAQAGNATDRALAAGLDFRLPVFPTCEVGPRPARAGGEAFVRSTGLLPNHPAHVFLGPITIANATTSANGSLHVTFIVPPDTATGKHLVTVGTIAVTGDCLLPVVGKDRGQTPTPGRDGTTAGNDTGATRPPQALSGPGLLAAAGVLGVAAVVRRRLR